MVDNFVMVLLSLMIGPAMAANSPHQYHDNGYDAPFHILVPPLRVNLRVGFIFQNKGFPSSNPDLLMSIPYFVAAKPAVDTPEPK